jgi:hypothetical protein
MGKANFAEDFKRDAVLQITWTEPQRWSAGG